VPAILLCALMTISVGFGMALAIPNPIVVSLITNALIVGPFVLPDCLPAQPPTTATLAW
jgi:hypothetical protein